MADLTPRDRAALAQIGIMDDPVRLRAMIVNARRLNAHVVEAAAFARLCFVQPEATPGTVEHDVWQSIHALEEVKREEKGKTVLLSRSREKIKRDGEAKTASDLTLRTESSAGFDDLIELGRPELTFEAVVLRHPKTFDATTMAAAKTRLAGAGVDISKIETVSEGIILCT